MHGLKARRIKHEEQDWTDVWLVDALSRLQPVPFMGGVQPGGLAVPTFVCLIRPTTLYNKHRSQLHQHQPWLPASPAAASTPS